MLDRMRVPILLLVSFTLIFPNQLMQAQGSASDQIEQADQLRNEGQPKAAIAMLEPMLQPGANAFSEDDLGFAWNVLGSSYQDLEMVSKARWCYETAMEKLRSISSARARYAAAIANLASLEVSLEQKDLSKGLYEKAGRIYEELGNSAGVAIVSTSLASITFSQKDYKNARRYLARALQEEQRAQGLPGPQFSPDVDTMLKQVMKIKVLCRLCRSCTIRGTEMLFTTVPGSQTRRFELYCSP
jgi:tetratricopeptide (TPR) repeat protein